jgi:DNA invertase Pin-like site-specific DNA recombinase
MIVSMTRTASSSRALIRKHATTTRVAIYVRISQDRTGAGMKTKRQERLCREWIAAHRDGWNVVEVYSDNDVSATSRKPRPEYLRMLADIEAGKIDAIVCWHVDRLTRKPAELEHVISMAEQHGLQLGTVTGEVDLSTPTGRLVARIVGAAARQEIEHKSERQRAASDEAARNGKPWSGGPRPFGYDFDRVATKPDEAELIRLAAKRVLAGESLNSIVSEWNRDGVKTSTGGRWSRTALRLVLTSARISGRREVGREGSKLGDIVADGLWESIIDVETSDKLRRLFSSPDRAQSKSATARHLLSSVLSCSICGNPMSAGVDRGGRRNYRCDPNRPTSKVAGCGRLSVSASGAEQHVEELVIEFLSQPRSTLLKRLAARHDESISASDVRKLTAAITKDEQELIDLMTDRQEGEITRAEWAAAREIVNERLHVNRSALSRATKTNALTLIEDASDMRERWEQLNLSQRRALLRDLFVTIRVEASKTRGGCRFDTDRLQPEWKL